MDRTLRSSPELGKKQRWVTAVVSAALRVISSFPFVNETEPKLKCTATWTY